MVENETYGLSEAYKEKLFKDFVWKMAQALVDISEAEPLKKHTGGRYFDAATNKICEQCGGIIYYSQEVHDSSCPASQDIIDINV